MQRRAVGAAAPSRVCLDARLGPARPGSLRTRETAGRRSGRVDGCCADNLHRSPAAGEEEAAAAGEGGGCCCCCWGRSLRAAAAVGGSSQECCRLPAAVVAAIQLARGPAAAGRGPSLSAQELEALHGQSAGLYIHIHSVPILGPGPASPSPLCQSSSVPLPELSYAHCAEPAGVRGRAVHVNHSLRTTTRAEPCSLRRAHRGYAAGRYVSVSIRTTTRAELRSLR